MLLILLVVNGFQELANFFDAGGLDLLVLVLHSDLASVLGFESGSNQKPPVGGWLQRVDFKVHKGRYVPFSVAG